MDVVGKALRGIMMELKCTIKSAITLATIRTYLASNPIETTSNMFFLLKVRTMNVLWISSRDLFLGGFGGWRVFPHGLYLEYIRTGNESYKDGVLFLGNNSALAHSGGDASADVNRETAYLIHTYNMMSKLGVDVPKREKAIQNAIGHVDQWFISKQPFLIQSFMVGLTCDAFIEYWEETKDERVPWIVQIALEG